ncbi:DNA cytosine methyltransferase [Paenibacillus sp. MBLB4367]|uniref:DNA cytosine methyltransferase n=1 Tax=Paenibacillus sp. MBLB4367 TaxID=3384767 RepID=UPI0039083750
MRANSLMREIIVDNFAGGGGASTGIELAIGRSVDIAINHDPAAIAMHKANHPETEHFRDNVWNVDPRDVTRGRPVGLAWFSPDCKHFSKAKGGKPVEKEIRGLAWVALRWAATVRPRVIMLENVEEFVTWGPLIADRDKETGRLMKKVFRQDGESFDLVVSEPGEDVLPELLSLRPDPTKKGRTFRSFVNALKRQGYQVDWRELRACDYGAPTIRKRLFLVARCDGRPVIWPKPTHAAPDSPAVKAGKLLPWRTAAEIIDWSLPCPSIFERSKPLAENTLRRIARGIQRFVIDNPNPFIVRIGQTGFGGDRLQYKVTDPLTTITTKAEHLLVTPVLGVNTTGHPGSSPDEPLRTITTGNHHMLVSPTLIEIGYGESPGQAPRAPGLNKPLGTVVAGGRKHAVVAAFIAKHYGGMTGVGVDTPLPTTTMRGTQNQLVTAHIARHFGESVGSSIGDPIGTVTAGGGGKSSLVTSHLVKLRGTCADGQPVTEPMPTITAGGLHVGEVRAFLLKYYGSADNGQTLDEPLHTVTTKDRFGLVTIHGVDYQIVDIGMRMLEPHELFAAQGFPPEYIIDRDAEGRKYPKSAQVARCGNSVPPPFAKSLVEANLPELCKNLPYKAEHQLELQLV